MQSNIHPDYQTVLFVDADGNEFLIPSTYKTKEMATAKDGQEYPTMALDTSSKMHPAYTGKRTTGEARGRSAQFAEKYRKKS